jgi:hypothetical protein
METKEIILGSKLIAEFLGWKYIPFNDLQDYSCAGWWKVAKPSWGDNSLGKYMLSKTKNHRDKIGRNYYVCRRHSDLKFWNSLDALVPVIKKIEREGGIVELHSNGCVLIKGDFKDVSFDLPNWSNNVFAVVVNFLSAKNENK